MQRRLRRWRCFCSVVKNPKRRFRFTTDLEKRSEMEATKHAPRASSTTAAKFHRDPRQGRPWDLDLGEERWGWCCGGDTGCRDEERRRVRPQGAGMGSGSVRGRRERGWRAAMYASERATAGMGSSGVRDRMEWGRGA